MNIENSGLTASGQTHPEIMVGDIFRDKYGSSTSTAKARANIQRTTSTWRPEK